MKLFLHVITMVCMVACFIAHAGEQPTARAKGAANQPMAVELQRLQGRWEGVMVGHEKDGKITITITSNSLHFHRDTNFWFETTFTHPVGTDPKQLHATIKGCAPGQESSVGQVVVAIYKIEDGTLTLVALGDGDEETVKSFEAAEEKRLSRYELRKVQPQKKNTKPRKTKRAGNADHAFPALKWDQWQLQREGKMFSPFRAGGFIGLETPGVARGYSCLSPPGSGDSDAQSRSSIVRRVRTILFAGCAHSFPSANGIVAPPMPNCALGRLPRRLDTSEMRRTASCGNLLHSRAARMVV